MQIHEYLTEVTQIGRRDFRVYPPRYADPYYVPPPPGSHRSNISGMGRRRGRGGLMGEDNEDVCATRRCYMTPLVQMEKAKRQFNRGQAAENRERQMARDNEREYEVIIPDNELETVGEPVDNVVPPRTPRTEPTPESRSKTPEFSSHHPNEERPENSIPQTRPSLRVNVTSEGVREVTTSEAVVVPPNSTIPSGATPNVPSAVWTSLSDHEQILRRTRD